MLQYSSNMPFSVKTIFQSIVLFIFVQKMRESYLELSQHDTKIHCFNKTGYQPCGSRFSLNPGETTFSRFRWTSSDQKIKNNHTRPRSDLVPEFDLSIPAAGDDLGGLVRMPQGTYAHFVVSLDPVVKLGGLPVPDVQLSVRISRHHVTGKKEKY